MENGRNSTINERILDLVEEMGGPSEVARMMGVDPQIFYNFKIRPDSQPNSKTLQKFFEVAPRANANYIYKGIGPKWLKEPEIAGEGFVKIANGHTLAEMTEGYKANYTPFPLPKNGEGYASPILISEDHIDWKARFEALEKKYDDLFKEYRDFVQSVTQKMKMSFNPASSHTTAEEQLYGFSFEIVGLTGSLPDEDCTTPVYALNSLDNVKPLHKGAVA